MLQLQFLRINYGGDMNTQIEILKVLVKDGESTVSMTSLLKSGIRLSPRRI